MSIKNLIKRVGGKVIPAYVNRNYRLSVLNYHSVGGGSLGSLSRDGFASHLAIISQADQYCTVNIDQGLGFIKDRTSVLITFDDGYLDNFQYAAPLLDESSIRAVFFITTAFIEGELDITSSFKSYSGLKPMSWDQIGQLHERGHTVGYHGHTHRSFASLDSEELAEEIGRSAELFHRRLGISPSVFAYPFGQLEHRHPEMNDIASSLGIRHIFSTENRGINLCAFKDGEFINPLPRLRVDAEDSALVVKEKIDGRWDYIGGIQRVRSCIRLRSLSAYGAYY